mmetsp:Transcript_132971/g.231118  ORF Transcript_132971/g.231118 Transcript_132971/m.231118 type:complete len:514 (-) Transcript_132971:147-1688(-)
MLRSNDSAKFDHLYDNFAKIGSGNFGSVNKANLRGRAGEYVAIKLVHKQDAHHEDMLDAFWNEVKILEKVLHPGVIRTYEVYDLEKSVYFVMEFCSGGEYLGKVKKTGEPFGLQETGAMVLAVLGALAFLHFKGISHRDLKPDNLLRDGLGCLKVADFGMANVFKASRASWYRKGMKGQCGTPGFWAPEVCSSGVYTEKCDMWSLGAITFYALSGGSLPFPMNAENEFGIPRDESEVSRLQIPKQCCDNSKALILSLLKMEPDKRPSAVEAVDLSYVKEIMIMQDAEQKTNKSIISDEFLKALWDFVMASPLTQIFGLTAARHLHISRVPEIEMLRRGFMYMDDGRDGFVPVKSIVQEMKLAPFLTPENDLHQAQKCFENMGRAAGSKPGFVDWSVFLATEAVKHRHSLESAYGIIKDKPEGVTVQALKDLTKSLSEAYALPSSLRGRRADSILQSDELLNILWLRNASKEQTVMYTNETGKLLDSQTTPEHEGSSRSCLCCARRNRVTPSEP